MPADAVFLDTNGWLALLNASDVLHSTASAVWNGLLDRGYSVLLTDWIVAETGNGLARTRARGAFYAATRLMLSSPRAQVITISEGLRDEALELYFDRDDKSWGLVDCASFLIMKAEGISEALTNDRHFAQAGFTCLLPLA